MDIRQITPSILLPVLLLFAATDPSHAASEFAKFSVGVELGGGVLERELPESRTDTKFYLAFNGGYRPTDRLLLGVEFGGFSVRGGSRWDPTKGAGISQRFLIAQFHQKPGFEGWYLKGGAGMVRYWDNRTDGVEDDGDGWLIAIGHDRAINGLGRFGPVFTYSSGESDRVEHRGLALAIRWSFP